MVAEIFFERGSRVFSFTHAKDKPPLHQFAYKLDQKKIVKRS